MDQGDIFKVGDVIQIGRYSCKVEKIFSPGGQGEVARVLVNGKPWALKWYHPSRATPQQLINLRRLAEIGPPDPVRFCWPVFVSTAADRPAYGYLMPLLPGTMCSPDDYFNPEIKIPRFRRQLAIVLAEISHCLALVHLKGLCYCDVSHNNIAFDPATGEVRLYDNDNVKPDDATAVHHTLGSSGFMAPEVVRRVSDPTKESDRFGLSVLLFWFLTELRSPYDGCIIDTIKAEGDESIINRELYGKPAPFVFHETDRSNRITDSESLHCIASWKGLPKFVRDRFTHAFVETPNQPRRRETSLTWRNDMVHLHDVIVSCPACGKEIYYDGHARAATDIGPCPRCKKLIPLPPRMRLTRGGGQRIIPLSESTRFFGAHLLPNEDQWEMLKPMASIVANPKNPLQLGLKNLTQRAWTGTAPDGKCFDIEPGKAVAIKHMMKVDFRGGIKGEFEI